MVKLAKDEQILEVVRKHWLQPLVHTIYLTTIFLAPLVLIFFVLGKTISTGTTEITLSLDNPSIVSFGVALWGLILWLGFFNFWTDHHLDGWIITNKRIIDVEQKGFFRREIASFRLERLQDATVEVHGILATILNFGEVHVQTAGSDKEFMIAYAPNPKHVKDLIMEQHDKLVEEDATKGDRDAVSHH